MTTQLAERLEARGFAAEALNGDMPQSLRESTVNRLKSGKLDILIATDVAARGLDVPRISHVINYDVPYDTETYVHRIGRTARAGREGDAIIFVSPREKRMLRSIEKATRHKIERMDLPSHSLVNERRVEKFKQRITDTLEKRDDNKLFSEIVESYCMEYDVTPIEMAAALASMAQGDSPLELNREDKINYDKLDRGDIRDRRGRDDRGDRRDRKGRKRKTSDPVTQGMERFHISVGKAHGVKPTNIVAAISSVAGLSDKEIGRIELHDRFSFIELPFGLSKEVFNELKKIKVAGEKLAISIVKDSASKPQFSARNSGGGKGKRRR